MWKKPALSIALATSLVVPTVLGTTDTIQAAEEPKYIDVQFLGINDFHGSIKNAAYLAGSFNQREAEAEAKGAHTIRVHAGDAVGASPAESSLLQDEPTMKILDKMNFKVGALGNHEFDEGLGELKRLYSGAEHPKVKEYTQGTNYKYDGISKEFKHLAANVIDKKTGQPVFDPYTVKEIGGVEVGFIGVVTTETPSVVMPEFVKDYDFISEADAINKYTQELKAKGVKAIVVLGHVGAETNKTTNVTTGEFADIAHKIDDEVDILFAAHSHKYANGVVDGKLIVQSQSHAKAFADIDAKIDPATKDFVKGEMKAEIVDVTKESVTPDAEIQKIVDEATEITKKVAGKEIAKAGSANPVGERKPEGGESSLGNLITDGQRILTGADFAITNSGGIRDSLNPTKNEKGEDIFTWGSAYAVQPFGNQVKTYELTGQQIKDALNQQWQNPARDMFLQISGFKYTYTKTDKGTHVVDMFLPDGKKMDLNQTYSVAMNEFLAGGGDAFTKFKEGRLIEGNKTDTEMFVDYITQLGQQGKTIAPTIEGRIKEVKAGETKPEPPTTGGETTNPEPPTTGEEGTKPKPPTTGEEGTKPEPPTTEETKDTVKETTDEKELPNTATNMYSMMAAGVAALLAGTVVFFRRRKQQQ